MAQSRVGIGLGLLLCLLAFTLACSVTKSISIGSISANPASYLGQKVTVSGEYRGWESGYGSPPVMRSDWVLKDSTGGIYVTGKTPNLDAAKDIGKPVTVYGAVRTKGNQVYLEAETIR